MWWSVGTVKENKAVWLHSFMQPLRDRAIFFSVWNLSVWKDNWMVYRYRWFLFQSVSHCPRAATSTVHTLTWLTMPFRSQAQANSRALITVILRGHPVYPDPTAPQSLLLHKCPSPLSENLLLFFKSQLWCCHWEAISGNPSFSCALIAWCASSVTAPSPHVIHSSARLLSGPASSISAPLALSTV